MHIPKYLRKKVSAPRLRDDIIVLESVYPDLKSNHLFLCDNAMYK